MSTALGINMHEHRAQLHQSLSDSASLMLGHDNNVLSLVHLCHKIKLRKQ